MPDPVPVSTEGEGRRTRCEFCWRPLATEAEWESTPEGEGDHLCWDGTNGCETLMYEHLAAVGRMLNDGERPSILPDGTLATLDEWRTCCGQPPHLCDCWADDPPVDDFRLYRIAPSGGPS